MATRQEFIAIDIGNSRIGLARFHSGCVVFRELPQPVDSLNLSTDQWEGEQIEAWLVDNKQNQISPKKWVIGSVHRACSDRMIGWIDSRPDSATTTLDLKNLPLSVDVDAPEKVGIDRLLAAVAANHIRDPKKATVIVDVGSAITVDLVNAEGIFLGGAILPGIGMSARALNQQTDLLPESTMRKLDAVPTPVGKTTLDAIRSGIFWGAIGGISRLVEELAASVSTETEMVITGGAAPEIIDLLLPRARYEPHLVTAGIAIAQEN